MNCVRRPLGKPFRSDPVIRALGYLMLCGPLAAALALGVHSSLQPPVEPAPGVAVFAPPPHASRPTMTTAVLRPRRDPQADVAFAAHASDNQLIAMAFTPTVDAALAAPERLAIPSAPRAELTTASTPAAAPRAVRANLENRPWRMQTLQRVGVAEGLRLIANGAMLNIAGVAPLAPGALCKRLDGVQEACATRAASRLEILTRGRTITCRVYDAAAGEPTIASCRADKIDIADDLVKNGLARRGDA